jgi:predicted nuclease of predicted toxin-antitoxin system
MARLLADENFPRPTAVELQRRGHDIISLDETGTASRESADEDVLQAAVSADRTLLTLDHQSFARLAPTCSRRPGVIVCAFDPDFIGLAGRIDAFLSVHDSLDGQIIRIGRGRAVSA